MAFDLGCGARGGSLIAAPSYFTDFFRDSCGLFESLVANSPCSCEGVPIPGTA